MTKVWQRLAINTPTIIAMTMIIIYDEVLGCTSTNAQKINKIEPNPARNPTIVKI